MRVMMVLIWDKPYTRRQFGAEEVVKTSISINSSSNSSTWSLGMFVTEPSGPLGIIPSISLTGMFIGGKKDI